MAFELIEAAQARRPARRDHAAGIASARTRCASAIA
jgi:hypothetical protein